MTHDTDSQPFLRRVLIVLGLTSLVVVGLWIVHQAADILFLFVLGLLFALFLDGGVRLLRRFWAIRRLWALLVVAVVLLALMTGAIWLFGPQVMEGIAELTHQLPQSLESLVDKLRETSWGEELWSRVSQLDDNLSLNRQAAQRFMGMFSTIAGALTSFLVILVLGIYLVIEPKIYHGGALRLIPASSRGRAREVTLEIAHALRWWLMGRLASMFVVFVLTWIGLLLLGTPLPFLLALLAGLLSFIPNLGPILSAIPAVLLSLAESPTMALYVIALYIGVQTVESYFITPFIQRRMVKVPPALLLTFQLIMGVLFGILGLFTATPILVIIMVLIQMLYIEGSFKEPVNLP